MQRKLVLLATGICGGCVLLFLLRRRPKKQRPMAPPGFLATSMEPALTSVDDGRKARTTLRFRIARQGPTVNDTLTLCWVSGDGSLCHHYKFLDDHTEETYTGDAFVVLDCDRRNLPRNVADVAGTQVVCSYRVDGELGPHHIHEVLLAHTGTEWTATARAAAKPDDEYRIIARLPSERHHLPPAEEDWLVEYVYRCPPLPEAEGYSSHHHTFYVWGDMDFDDYGAGAQGRHGRLSPEEEARVCGLHPCTMNQIVPQLMTGRCLAANDAGYKPIWHDFDYWVIQAQYFWCDQGGEHSGCHAQCGEFVRVEPGDLIRTTIRYNASAGSIDVQIFVEDEKAPRRAKKGKLSQIALERPFPHDPSLFRSWRDFFEKSQALERSLPGRQPSVGPLGRPCLNVEYKGSVSVAALKSVCPFEVLEASFPGCENKCREWRTELFCPRLGETPVLAPDANGDEAVGAADRLHIYDSIVLGGKRGGSISRRLHSWFSYYPKLRG
eukprot:TRINITY_DN39579_c0_g1_i2.p1 TRINITY_DN39579_c0_g1~~TRINITY_DN39579_c0_g1_i2.p1  ORF type:complete len:495 (-),score=72.23 TRINITY_DN39579_c0_g1_i2:407-1891(-)